VILACVLAAIAAVIGLTSGDKGTGDYANPICYGWSCDDPSRSLHAIATGDIGGFFRFQPAMGLTSLLLRAPVVAIAHGGGGDIKAEYQAGAAICLVAATLIVVWLAWLAHRRGARLSAVLLALALWMTAILASRALLLGHPEEGLAAALAIAAIALAAYGHPIAAGVLIGLAIGTKEWALLVAPAVLFAGSSAQWLRVAGAAFVVAVLAVGVMFAGSPSTFHRAHEGQRAGDKRTVTPATLWFRLGEKKVVGQRGDLVFYEVYPPKAIGRWCRPFVILFALVAALLFWRRRGFSCPAAFALAAFVLLARALFDTQTFSYHLIPMLMAVVAWELFALRRLPVIGLATTVAFQLTVHVVASSQDISSYGFNAIFLAWSLPLFVLLGVATYRRSPTPWARPSTHRPVTPRSAQTATP
jgi:hypothetical protein